jgi:hypothetical protein
MDFNVQSGRLATNGLRITMLAAAIALAGCGGGGSSNSVGSAGTTPTNPTTPTIPLGANKLYFMVDQTAINIAGDTLDVSVRVIDGNNGTVADSAVTFSITDPTLTGVFNTSGAVVVTDENGLAKISLSLAPASLTTEQKAYLTTTGVKITARVGNASSGISSSSMVLKGEASSGTVINKIDKYDLTIAAAQSSLSTGGGTTDVIVNVNDKQGGLVVGAPVLLAISDAAKVGVTLSLPSSQVTDEKGQVKFSLTSSALRSFAYVLNHSVTLSVTVNDGVNLPATQQAVFDITGTSLALTADKTIIDVGGNLTVYATARDGASRAISGISVNLFDRLGAVVGTATTNTLGVAKFTLSYSALNPDQDSKISLNAKMYAGANGLEQASDSAVVIFSKNGDFAFSSLPVTDTAINGNAQVVVQVRALDVADIQNKTMRLTSSLGTVDQNIKTIENVHQVSGFFIGDVTFNLTSLSPGTANIKATFGADAITSQISFISTIPAKISIQPNQTVVGPKNSTPIVALVLDENNSPVKGALVLFSLEKDSSAGVLSSSEGITDENGEAKVIYTAGGINTASDGVAIVAKVGSYSNTTHLTVSSRAVKIAIGTSNKIASVERDVYYDMPVSANVVDNSGNPLINQEVSVRIVPTQYYKGSWAYGNIRIPPYDDSADLVYYSSFFTDNLWYMTKAASGASDHDRRTYSGDVYYDGGYVKQISAEHRADLNAGLVDFQGYYLPNDHLYTSPYTCDPEDTNANSTLDTGEDLNGNGHLDGMNIATILGVSDSNGIYTLKTDASGKFDFNLRYLKRYAQWQKIKIIATTRVQGTEYQGEISTGLPVLAIDIDDFGKVDRPNSLSPYGVNPCNIKD